MDATHNLNTIRAYIDYIKESLRATSSNTELHDKFVYDVWRTQYFSLLEEYKIRNVKLNWKDLTQTICLSLCDSTASDCDCEDLNYNDKLVKRTSFKLPNYIGELKITDLSTYSYIFERSPYIKGYEKYGSYKLKKDNVATTPFYQIRNNYLYIYDTTIPTILVTGIFTDPAYLSEIQSCESNSENNTNTCFNWLEDEFKVNPIVQSKAILEAMRLLSNTQLFPEDESNNLNASEPKVI